MVTWEPLLGGERGAGPRVLLRLDPSSFRDQNVAGEEVTLRIAAFGADARTMGSSGEWKFRARHLGAPYLQANGSAGRCGPRGVVHKLPSLTLQNMGIGLRAPSK